MEQNYQLNLIVDIPNAQVIEYVNKQQKPITSGNLGVYEVQQLGLFILKINDWQYTLNKEIPVMKEQTRTFSQHIYIMPKDGGNFGVAVAGNAARQLIDCLESVLNQHSNFVVPDQYQLAVDAAKNDPELQKQISGGEEKLTGAKVGAFLHLGGDYIRQGLIQGSKVVSKGIKAGGQFIQTKITKPKPVKVDPSTLQKVKGASAGSSIMLQYTRAQIQTLYQALKSAAVATGQQLEESESGVKIKSHKNYEDVKNVALGGVHGVAAVYDGMFEALCEIGRGVGEATVGVVDKQYGGEAAEAAQEGVKIVGNVGYIVKATKDTVQKDLVKDTSDQTYGGIKPKLQ